MIFYVIVSCFVFYLIREKLHDLDKRVTFLEDFISCNEVDKHEVDY